MRVGRGLGGFMEHERFLISHKAIQVKLGKERNGKQQLFEVTD
jgi:hypothetical protein